ncbi:hypothetical protein CPTAKMNP4_019 [Salmonella phage vB_SenM-AKM_NP4]|uniref:Uncharacterized protein n=2 Tax=Gelderlandvirus TaxID=1913653 RepID=M1HNQ9_BPS16|nr:hypothetical protein I133_gp252 [Salmonella phage vB_SenM-S16]YP_009126223.1 hypothetical protein STP4a_014 [Salmonella phage STP4-a]UFK27142.1 hypothetical protein LG358_00121 [Escherichia phage UoN_LG358_1]WDR21685.1 hypothetical protein PJM34_0017 [Salmonella phage vB_SenM_UTK0003]WKV23364.1 hypothetical protein SEA1_gp0016 [Salmonella phage SEA1]WLI71644.1 hypothetical protein CPTAKMNP4_019 [Salmonella phage vB_SenM-AKM_NP4]AGE48142.1 hypothetical protein [Salmonella phage vB_SenM-S16]
MHYGYMLVYKDKDGFELPYFESGKATIYEKFDDAVKHYEQLKTYLTHILNVGKVETTIKKRRFWFDKVEMKFKKLSEIESRMNRQIMNTLSVKRVSVV